MKVQIVIVFMVVVVSAQRGSPRGQPRQENRPDFKEVIQKAQDIKNLVGMDVYKRVVDNVVGQPNSYFAGQSHDMEIRRWVVSVFLLANETVSNWMQIHTHITNKLNTRRGQIDIQLESMAQSLRHLFTALNSMDGGSRRKRSVISGGCRCAPNVHPPNRHEMLPRRSRRRADGFGDAINSGIESAKNLGDQVSGEFANVGKSVVSSFSSNSTNSEMSNMADQTNSTANNMAQTGKSLADCATQAVTTMASAIQGQAE